MTVEENKALLRRIIDQAFNERNLGVVDELLSEDFVGHSWPPEVDSSREGLKQLVNIFTVAFPDLHVQIDELIAEGDKVVARVTTGGTHQSDLMGMAATGKRVSFAEVHIIRIANGKAVEHWGVEDSLGMMQQLGVIPAD